MRFAGDFFGVPLTTPEEGKESALVDYFPELRSIKRSSAGNSEEGARSYGNVKAVAPFAGFKTMEGQSRDQSAPKFFGFKTFEQSKN